MNPKNWGEPPLNIWLPIFVDALNGSIIKYVNPVVGVNHGVKVGVTVGVTVFVGVGDGQLKQVIKFVITKFGSKVGRLVLSINILL